MILVQSALLGGLVVVFAVALQRYVEKVMLTELEAKMQENAAVVGQMVRVDLDDDDDDDDDDRGRRRGRKRQEGKWELEIETDEYVIDTFDRNDAKSSYVILNADGKALEASRYAPAKEGVSYQLTPAVGDYAGEMRYLVHEFLPQGMTKSSASWRVVVFSSLSEIEKTKETIRKGSAVCGLTLVLVSALIGGFLIRSGLSPLRAVARQVGELDENNLGHRFETEAMPSEVAPVGVKLNAMLEKLDEAFIRERRFSGSAAHELRTPLAELKAIVQVGAQSCGDDTKPFFEDSNEVIKRMESLLVTLLTLIKKNVEGAELKWGEVELSGLVKERVEQLDGKQRVILNGDILKVKADVGLLTRVVDNLIGNALRYADEESEVTVRWSLQEGRGTFTVENSCNELEVEDLEQLVEPFWRKDGARTSGDNQGLGLSLVQVYCEMMGWQLSIDGELPQVRVSIAGIQSV